MSYFNNNDLTAEKSYEQKTAWVYLLNLGFYFIPLFFMQGQWLNIIVALLILVPFIFGYFWAYNSTTQKAHYPITLMLTCAIVATPFTSGTISLFSFVCFFIGFFYTLRTAILGFLAIFLLLFALNQVVNIEGYYFAFYGMGISLGVGIFGIIEQNRQRIKRQHKRSQDEITQLATALERERIARDLHDIMGHNLSSIALKAELAGKLLHANQLDLAQTQLSQLAEIARDSLSQIRQTVSNYKHKGLQACLPTLVQSLRDQGMEVNVEGDTPSSTELIESQLALILTEAVNNCLKHSHAERVSLIFAQDENNIHLSLSQNTAAKEITEGNGLKGMRERVDLLNGTFEYQTTPVFTINITLPNSTH